MCQFKDILSQLKIHYVVILLWTSVSSGFSQDYSLADITINWNGKLLNSPFVGGLIAPQFSEIDLDLDGYSDLLIFDRVGDIVITYIYNEEIGNYTFAPEYKSVIPELLKWVIVRDYNNDGVADIFTGSVVGSFAAISCYRGSIVDGQYQFDLYKDESEDLALLYYQSISGSKEIYNSIIDKPEVLDFDRDGDLDVISFNSSGSKVDYYKNVAVENGLSLESLTFIRESDCFGGFEESGVNEVILLSNAQGECFTQLEGEPSVELRHSGSTLTGLDIDGDLDYDLLIGDLTSNKLALLYNAGTLEEAWMNDVYYDFPVETESVNMPVFLSAFIIDVDKDGKQDVLVAPNGESNVSNINNVLYYKNTADSGFDLDFVRPDFLKDEMLDFGLFSNPKFVDVNQDGLDDIIVGTRGIYIDNNKDEARLLYLENVGSADTPQFELIDDDFADFNQYSEQSLDFAPGFGDLDGDGDIDMVVGDPNGYIYYSENIAGINQPLEFTNPIYQYKDIRPGQLSKPTIFDLNDDGLGDLIIGERNGNAFDGKLGSINYYENIGEVGKPDFNSDLTVAPNTPVLGGVLIKGAGDSDARSCPEFFEMGDSLFLFSGSRSGRLHMYSNIRDNIEGIFDTVSVALGNIDEGDITTMDVSDIDNDGYLEMVVGNERGGIAIFNTDIIVDINLVPTKEQVQGQIVSVYPNPLKDNVTIESKSYIKAITLMDLQGRLLYETADFGYYRTLDLSENANGIYILSIKTANGNTTHRKLIKQ